MQIRKSVFAIVSVLSAAVQLGATPAPPRELQKNAPEQLVIEVRSVQVARISNDSTLKVHIEALVVSVASSASHVNAGQSVVIEYLTQTPSQGSRIATCSTPQMPVLSKSRQYKSYLAKSSDGTFSPAASWVSFDYL